MENESNESIQPEEAMPEEEIFDEPGFLGIADDWVEPSWI